MAALYQDELYEMRRRPAGRRSAAAVRRHLRAQPRRHLRRASRRERRHDHDEHGPDGPPARTSSRCHGRTGLPSSEARTLPEEIKALMEGRDRGATPPITSRRSANASDRSASCSSISRYRPASDGTITDLDGEELGGTQERTDGRDHAGRTRRRRGGPAPRRRERVRRVQEQRRGARPAVRAGSDPRG